MATSNEGQAGAPERYEAPVATHEDKLISGRAKRAMKTLSDDRTRVLDMCDNYLRGDHDKPYYPSYASEHAKQLAEKSVTNWMPLIVGVPAQIALVDGFRRDSADNPPEWAHWRRNRMAARQTPIYRSALTYGQSFAGLWVKDGDKDDVRILSLSPLKTTAFYDDSSSDEFPVFAVSIIDRPLDEKTPGRLRYWDELVQCEMYWTDEGVYTVIEETRVEHGFGECPVGRFVTHLDLEGRARGVVESMKAIQDRINQTVFDLMIAQTYGAHKQRWAAGLIGDPVLDAEGEHQLDADGEPMFKPLEMDPSVVWSTDDPNAKFGSLDETPLDGYISSLEMSVRQMAAISQVPPHALLGMMANLSAEALDAAESQMQRMVEQLRGGWGSTWAGLFRLIAVRSGSDVTDYSGDTRWRDMSAQSIAATVDALGKAVTMLGIPARGLWKRVPGTTDSDIINWDKLSGEDATAAAAADPTNVFGQALAAEEATARRLAAQAAGADAEAA